MLPNETLESMVARQTAFEDHCLALGGERFRRKLEEAMTSGTESTAGAAKKLLVEGLDKVEAALNDLVNAGGSGRPHAAKRWVKLLGTDVAAFISLKVVLDHIHGRVSVRRAAQELCSLIQDELRFRRFKEKEPKLFEYAMSGFNTGSYAHMARSLDARIHRADIDCSDLVMTANETWTVGVKLLDTVIVTTGLVAVEKMTVADENGCQERVELVATPETIAWLKERNEALEFLFPVHLPMLMPPLPWGKGSRGGYRFALRGKHRIVRTSGQRAKMRVEEASMPKVYEAVNRVQETAWRINTRVLGVLETILGRGGGIAGVPLADDAPMPPKPADIDTNEEACRAWRRAASAVHEANHEQRGHRLELLRLLQVAGKVKEEAAIWFPHNCDFRGRVYPVTNFLSPQGDDRTKALLLFANGKALGRDGAAYLALHGCNSLGKTYEGLKTSKFTLQERVDYIVSISQSLCAVALDPIGNLGLWEGADDPWQFLAFCFEWADYLKADGEGRGQEFVSCLPVAADGTCNGLQHFAALWLDPVGGAAVNVVPQDRPQDIYQRVADQVLDRLEREAASEPLAALWLKAGIVDRKLAKRPTMTFGYGSQQFGFAQQLREYVSTHGEWRSRLALLFIADVTDEETGEVKAKSTLHPACTYMAKLIWESLEVVAVSAFQGMAWMRASAKAISMDAGKCMEWVVPGTGFPVTQTYMTERVTRTRTILAGGAFRPTLWEDTDQPNWKKQTSSAAPNIVHSLDAAALHSTVVLAAAQGIEAFAMVHDSYGTLAGDAGLLATLTRQAFVALYGQRDVVADFEAQFRAQVSPEVEMPEPPPRGNLDLSGVLASDYFFS